MTIVIEGTEKSGSLITARLATEYGASVGALPGPITSIHSSGPHILLKLGATPITSALDILEEIGITQTPEYNEVIVLNTDEQRVMQLLDNGPVTKESIIKQLSFSATQASVTCSMLELKGLIRESLGCFEKITRHIC